MIDSTIEAYPSFKDFNGYQNGGRIVTNEKDIFLTIGDYNQWERPQDSESIFGKILKINKYSFQIKKISKGHRNQQGMYNLSDSKIIISPFHDIP